MFDGDEVMNTKLVRDFLKEGGNVSLTLKEDKLYYTIDTGMKSNFTFRHTIDDNYDVITRYKSFDEHLESVKDLLSCIYDECMCGRDYMSGMLRELLVKYHIIT